MDSHNNQTFALFNQGSVNPCFCWANRDDSLFYITPAISYQIEEHY